MANFGLLFVRMMFFFFFFLSWLSYFQFFFFIGKLSLSFSSMSSLFYTILSFTQELINLHQVFFVSVCIFFSWCIISILLLEYVILIHMILRFLVDLSLKKMIVNKRLHSRPTRWRKSQPVKALHCRMPRTACSDLSAQEIGCYNILNGTQQYL